MNYNCWPNYNQELLLKSCLSPEDESYIFWKKWLENHREPIDLLNEKNTLKSLYDQLDQGSQRLLPLLYRKISRIDPDDRIIKSIKGYYLNSWYRNQILLQKLKNILIRFKPFNIETIVLKGLPLSVLYYKDFGTRPMSDFDLVVKPENSDLSLSLIQSDGWIDMRTQKPFKNVQGLLSDSRALVDQEGHELDFHWKLFKETYDLSLDRELWENKIPFWLEDLKTYSLNPTDQLLNTLVHGLEGNEVPSIRWVADAILIIRSEKIDWDLLFQRAVKRKLTPFIKESLKYLGDKFSDTIPAGVIEKSNKLITSENELKYFRQKLKLNPAGTINWLLLRHFQYRLYNAHRNIFSELKDLMLHYRNNWGIDKSLIVIPVHILLHLLKIIKHPFYKSRPNK